MADTSKGWELILLAGALGLVGYYLLKKQQAQGGASQTSGQGGTQQGTTGGGTSYSGTGGTSFGSCPTCGGGTTSPPSQPSQPSQPSRPTTTSVPPNISTLIGLITGQLAPTPPTPALQQLLGREGPQAPTPALQYLLGQAPVTGGITLGPIRILF
jgi:hypothetical protein